MKGSIVRTTIVLGLAAVGALLAACKDTKNLRAAGATSTAITVAAASSVKAAMEEIALEWGKEHPGAPAQVTGGSSGNFAAQIAQGAPFDVFFSADMQYPGKLRDDGHAEGEVVEYATGTLVVWSIAGGATAAERLRDPSVKHIAIANPDHAPYGRAAVQALKAMDLWTEAEPRIVRGENVEQAASFARSGAAEVAIIPRSVAMAMTGGGTFVEVPASAYEPIRHGAIVVKGRTGAAAAREFVAFVRSDRGQEILASHGFGVSD